MCILSGCDYLASVPGIGLGKSLKLMKRFNRDPYRVSLHYTKYKLDAELRELRDLESRGPDVASRV